MASLEIPNIELFEELGRGAFSIVYRARRGTQPCAVKVPRESSSHQARRFRTEAVALARVRHPALPTVWEVGEAREIPYLVMELAGGETLARRLTRGTLPWDQTIDLGRRLASALSEIHRLGLVHCDVKPANIIIADNGDARLIDFGLAASADTGSLVRAGTFPYAAPEQMAQTYQQIDARADLYGLGAVLHECLFGEPPATGPQPGSPGPAGWGSGVRLKQPAHADNPASSFDSATADVASAILSRLLEHDPDERYQSAAGLARDLSRIEEIAREIRDGREPQLALREAGEALFVGRDSELAALNQVLQEPLNGDGRMALLQGPAGTGKSALVRAFQSDAMRAGATILAAAGARWGTKPFSVVVQLLEGYLGGAVTAEQRAARERRMREAAGEFGRYLKVLSPRLAETFADAREISESVDAQYVFIEGLSQALSRLARATAPTLLLVDDIQWLDAASASVLKRVSAEIDTQGTLMLLALRTERGAVGTSLEVVPETAMSLESVVDPGAAADMLVIELEPLGTEAIRELVTESLGTAPGDDVVAWISSLSDGTPLNVLEVLRSLLDDGLLVPHWGGWQLSPGALEQARLPQRTLEIVVRRIHRLSPACRVVLAAAAVLGGVFPQRALSTVSELTEADVAEALLEAQQAQLIHVRPRQAFAFVHESVRDAVLAAFVRDSAPNLHRRAAMALEVLAASGEASLDDPEFAYAVATHHVSASPNGDSERSLTACLRAAKIAFSSCDNTRAIRFFRAAIEACRVLGMAFDPRDRVVYGEALLRIGLLTEALIELEGALTELADPIERAHAWMRVAWAHSLRWDTELAWPALERGFAELGERLPREAPAPAVVSLAKRFKPFASRAPKLSDAERRRLEAVWLLSERAAYLANEGWRPLTWAQASLKLLDVAERLGAPRQLCVSQAGYAFLLVSLGFRTAGLRWLERAEEGAQVLGDPSTRGWIWQFRSITIAWCGDIEGSIEASSRCLVEYGAWRGLYEYCFFAWNLQSIESMRGRMHESWVWLKRGLQRIELHEGRPLIPDVLALSTRAALTALGRESEIDTTLNVVSRCDVRTSALSDYQLLLFGTRLRVHTERGDFGPEFEAIVSDFKSRRYDPKKVHLIAGEFCTHLAYARVEICLRAPPGQRTVPLKDLDEALADLRRVARIPLLEAHRSAVEGYAAFLHNDLGRAERWFEKAAELGERERAPWVLYAAHRGRAHVFRARGRLESALVHARMAELHARQHGAAYRLRWVREEFDLGSTPLAEASATATAGSPITQSRQRRQLRALLRLSQAASEELGPEAQRQRVIDELLRAAGAARAALVARDTDGSFRILAGRNAGGSDIPFVIDGAARELCERVLGTQITEISDDTEALSSRLAAPFRTSSTPVCVLFEAAGCGIFADDDARMLEMLTAQAGVSLALGRSLRALTMEAQATQAREQRQTVDAVLGSVASEFDRIVGEIQARVDSTWVPLAEEQQRLVRSTQRARRLAQHLLTLAEQSGELEHVNLNSLIDGIRPALARIVREPIELLLGLDPNLEPVRVHPVLIEQLLTNLALAARQLSSKPAEPPPGPRGALEHRNFLAVETRPVEVDRMLASRLSLLEGAYALLTVSLSADPEIGEDTGEGESSRWALQEPMGLWLAGAYGPALHSRGGHLSVTRAAGVATSFSVLIPLANGGFAKESGRAVSMRALGQPAATEQFPSVRPHVLLVEDDLAQQSALSRALEREGIDVVACRDANSALDHLEAAVHFDSVVCAVPFGAGSREMLDAMGRCAADATVVFTSSHAACLLVRQALIPREARVLVKPFAAADLVTAVLDKQSVPARAASA